MHPAIQSDGHDREHHPALPLVLDEHAEASRERECEEHGEVELEEVRELCGVLERVCRVDVEEATAVAAELLDGHPTRDGPARDELRRTLDGRDRL